MSIYNFEYQEELPSLTPKNRYNAYILESIDSAKKIAKRLSKNKFHKTTYIYEIKNMAMAIMDRELQAINPRWIDGAIDELVNAWDNDLQTCRESNLGTYLDYQSLKSLDLNISNGLWLHSLAGELMHENSTYKFKSKHSKRREENNQLLRMEEKSDGIFEIDAYACSDGVARLFLCLFELRVLALTRSLIQNGQSYFLTAQPFLENEVKSISAD